MVRWMISGYIIIYFYLFQVYPHGMIRIEIDRRRLLDVSTSEEVEILFQVVFQFGRIIDFKLAMIGMISCFLMLDSDKWVFRLNEGFLFDVVGFWIVLTEDLVCNCRRDVLVHLDAFDEFTKRSLHSFIAHLLDTAKRLRESPSRLQSNDVFLL